MYGIQHEDSIAYLVQKDNVQNAVGLKTSPAFSHLRQTKCLHNIDLSLPEPTPEFIKALPKDFYEDPLIKALSPIPKEERRVLFLEDDFDTLQLTYFATQMVSPIVPTISPLGWINIDKIKNDLFKSNIFSQVITNVGEKKGDITLLVELAKATLLSPSKLVFFGDKMFPLPQNAPVLRCESKIKLTKELESTQEWQRLGAMMLRKHMRNAD